MYSGKCTLICDYTVTFVRLADVVTTVDVRGRPECMEEAEVSCKRGSHLKRSYFCLNG